MSDILKLNQKKRIVKRFDAECSILAFEFIKIYFPINPEFYCVADDPSGVWYINDYFFNLSDMRDYLKYNYSQKKMIEHYWYSLDQYEKNEVKVNIKSYKKLKSK